MRVRIVDAPGFEDFEGELIMTVPRIDGVSVSAVGYTLPDGRRDFELVESRYVEEVGE